MQRRTIAAAGLVLALGSASASAQLTLYLDDVSSSSCDLVNASNTELAVLADTQELVIIAGQDVVLLNTFVDDTGEVFVDNELVGFVEFATDGDGFRTLWWVTLTGTVVAVDSLTGDPFDSGFFPDDFIDAPCDACVFWDDPFECGGIVFDSDGDGITDPFDLCRDTGFGFDVDEDGCACYEADSDADGVDDCDDFCPFTPFDVFVDFDGCSCVELDDDADGIDNCDDLCDQTPFDALVDSDGCEIVVIIDDGGSNTNTVSLMCGSFGTLSLAMMLVGLASFRSRRWVR
jgi:hypothetical protein